MSYPNKSRFISIYRALQSGHPSAQVGLKSLSTEQQKQFDQFMVDAGNAFLEIKDELDAVIEGLGDQFSDSDPRKWEPLDWSYFFDGVQGHPLEKILIRYAQGENNMSLIWDEIEARL